MNSDTHSGATQRRTRKSGSSTRFFTPDVYDGLTQALTGYEPQSRRSEDELRNALVVAAMEARAQKWQPEELVTTLNRVVSESSVSPDVSDQIRALIKRRALVAFFGQAEIG